MSTEWHRLTPEALVEPKTPPQVLDRIADEAELRAAGFKHRYDRGVHSIHTLDGFKHRYDRGVHSIHTLDGRLFIESLSFAGAMQAFRNNVQRIRRAA